MELFKTEKKPPIKLRNFNFIGYHKDYVNCCYYYKELANDNFELMEMMLEGAKKPEIGAGTKVQILDAFMSNYLYFKNNKIKYKDNLDFIHKVCTNTYKNLTKKQKDEFIKKFTSKVPSEIKRSAVFKKYIDNGYEILYCSNDESKTRLMGIVNIVLVKVEHLYSEDKRIELDRYYSLFKPLKYLVTPGYIKGTSKTKYYEEELPQIVVSHDLLK